MPNSKNAAPRWRRRRHPIGPGAVTRICSTRPSCRPTKAAISISCAARARARIRSAPLLPLAGELLHRNTEIVGVHRVDDLLFLGIELLPDRRHRGLVDQ